MPNEGNTRNHWLLRKKRGNGGNRTGTRTLQQLCPRWLRPIRVRMEDARCVPCTKPSARKHHINARSPLADALRHPLELTRTLTGQWSKCVIGPLLGVTISGLGVTNDEEFHGFMVLSGTYGE